MTVFDLVANRSYGNKHVLTKLIEHHVWVPYKEIILHYDDEVSSDAVQKIVSDYWLYEKDKMPLEYIVWHVDFLARAFAIDKRAMIPRPETEYMINGVCEHIEETRNKEQETNNSMEILDLGCGCGVLGLSVGLQVTGNREQVTGNRELEAWSWKLETVSFWDISADAIDLAQINIESYRNALEGVKLTARVSNGLQELKNHPELLERWKNNNLIIVCNYPYIPDDTFEENADECAKTREPRLAFLGGPDGLDLYRVLFGEIETFGLTGAVLFLEMLTWQAESLEKEFGDRMEFQIIKTFHFNIVIVKTIRKN
jgi:HemK-like putative methylase